MKNIFFTCEKNDAEREIYMEKKIRPTGMAYQGAFGQRLKYSFKHHYELYLLALPTFLYVLIFSYLPIYGLQMAFQDFSIGKGFSGSDWVGFEHFIKFFKSYKFWPTLWNTVSLSLYGLAAGFFPSIILALLLHHVRNKKFGKAVQMMTYAPHFISVVVLASMLRLMLSPTSGVINTFIQMFGGGAVDFMGSADMFPHIYVWSGVWQSMGWGSIIYLSALCSISPELYEAAKIDGANEFQRILHVDIPGITPTIITMLILNCGSVMSVGMQKVLLLQTPLNLEKSEIISTYVYKSGILNAQYGYSAAVGLFQSVVNVILLVTVNGISRKVSENSLW